MSCSPSALTIRWIIASILGLAASTVPAMGNRPTMPDDEGVSQRIQPVARVEFAAASPAGSGMARSGEDLFKSACAVCHQTGAAGAPAIGNKAAWSPRLAQGLEGLVKSATAGKNAMPPNGGSNASPLELTRAIIHMANKSGASFKEPAK